MWQHTAKSSLRSFLQALWVHSPPTLWSTSSQSSCTLRCKRLSPSSPHPRGLWYPVFCRSHIPEINQSHFTKHDKAKKKDENKKCKVKPMPIFLKMNSSSCFPLTLFNIYEWSWTLANNFDLDHQSMSLVSILHSLKFSRQNIVLIQNMTRDTFINNSIYNIYRKMNCHALS